MDERSKKRAHTASGRRKQAPGEGNDSSSGTVGTAGTTSPQTRPDYLLVLCLILIYLELSWLILMLLRTYSRH